METEYIVLLQDVEELKEKFSSIKKDIETLQNLLKSENTEEQNIKEFAENIRRQLISLIHNIWIVEDILYERESRDIKVYDIIYSNEKYNYVRIECTRYCSVINLINLIESIKEYTEIFDDIIDKNEINLRTVESKKYHTYFDLHFSIKVNELRIVKITYIIEERELYIDIVPIEEFLKELEEIIEETIKAIREYLAEDLLEEF